MRTLRSFRFESAVGRGLASALPGWMPVPVPGPMVRGLDGQALDLEQAEMPNYLNGRWARKGWWYYYPQALLLKTPLAVWVFLLLAAGAAVATRRALPSAGKSDPRARLAIWMAGTWAGAVVLSALTSQLNIGVRYLLPAFPSFFLLMAGCAVWLGRRGRWAPWVLAGLGLCYVGAPLSVHPHYLPFFNRLAGGPAGGWRYLANSNNDWGQDLPLLARWLEMNEIVEPIHLAYFGHLDPAHYGIPYEVSPDHPQAGIHVVSLNLLLGLPYPVNDHGEWRLLGAGLTEPQNHLAWLRGRQPEERLGETLWIYRMPPRAPAGPGP